jgi:hypothetical protein
MCEGLSALELRCDLPQHCAELTWRDAMRALVAGWRIA